MPKIHETWPTDNRFICGGTAGPLSDSFGSLCIYICIFGAVIPFSIIMFQPVWDASPALPILFYISAALSIVLLNLTACTDPGIIPRRPYLAKDKKFQKYLEERQEG